MRFWGNRNIQTIAKKYQSYTYIYQEHSCKICEAKTDRTEGEIDKPTIIVWHFNTSLSTTGRKTRQKISKDEKELNNTINQQDLIDSNIKHFTQQLWNTHSFQVLVIHISMWTKSWAINQTSNLKELES